jgi:hypothetical protein
VVVCRGVCSRGSSFQHGPTSSADRAGCGRAPRFGSHGGLWVKMFGSGFHGKSPVVAPCPRSEPVCRTRPVSDVASNSHPVAALIGRTNFPLASGEGSGGRDHSLLRLFKLGQISVRSPGSAGADQAPKIEKGEAFVFKRRPLSRLLPAQPQWSHISRRRSAAFRAKATISTFRTRLPLSCTR